jgi:ABC-type polysaccharide/polyol phosphate transport system ATPase subunit
VATIVVDNVSVSYPIYGAAHKSLRKTLFAHAGGFIRREGRRERRVVVSALNNVSFRLDHGDRVGIVGHNGAGKTTLLRVLAGVYWPDSGTVRIEGRVSPMFTSAPGLDPEDNGYQNIKTCGMFLGMSVAEVASKLPDIAEFSGLGEYLNLPVRTYSAGMVTRLCFAIATAIDPDILLLDEGLAAGDAGFAARAETRMQDLIARTGILALATHSDSLIRDMCNKAILLERGRLIRTGGVEEILETYHRANAEAATRAA